MENLENSLINAEEELTMHYKNKVIEEAVKDIIRGVRDYVLARMESDRNQFLLWDAGICDTRCDTA